MLHCGVCEHVCVCMLSHAYGLMIGISEHETRSENVKCGA